MVHKLQGERNHLAMCHRLTGAPHRLNGTWWWWVFSILTDSSQVGTS